MIDDDIPEVDEEWFKKAMLRRELRFYDLVGRVVVPRDDINVSGLIQREQAIQKTGQDPWQVGLAEVGGGRTISTVFLSMDHRHIGDGPPLLFETMMFTNGRADVLGRCSTWEEAEAMHEKAVEDARKLRVVK